MSLDNIKILNITIVHLYVFDKIETDSCRGFSCLCMAEKQCIYRGKRCDNTKDCPNGEDETGCGNKIK